MALDQRSSFFVFGGWNHLTAQVLLSLFPAFGREFAIWTDTPNLSRKRSLVKRLTRGPWLRYVFAKAKAVMGTGALALENLAAMGCPREKLVNLPYVIDAESIAEATSQCRAARSGQADARPVFLSCGRLVNEHKGYHLAIQALARVRDKLGHSEFRYRIAGSGPDEGALRKLAADLALTDNVEFVGWLEPRDLPEFLAGGQYFLHPALFEPYGVAVLEAMAAGLVVIGSDRTGAIVDRLMHGRAGFVHKAGDVDSIANSIIEAMSAKDSIACLAVESRLAAGEWSAGRAVAQVKKVIF